MIGYCLECNTQDECEEKSVCQRINAVAPRSSGRRAEAKSAVAAPFPDKDPHVLLGRVIDAATDLAHLVTGKSEPEAVSQSMRRRIADQIKAALEKYPGEPKVTIQGDLRDWLEIIDALEGPPWNGYG